MNKKRIEIGMVAKRSLPIFVFTTFLFVLADSAFAAVAKNLLLQIIKSKKQEWLLFLLQCNNRKKSVE